MSDDIKEKARRVIAQIKFMRSSGLAGTEKIGQDALDIARFVLDLEPAAVPQEVLAVLGRARALGLDAARLLRVDTGDACACRVRGPSQEVSCGGYGEYDPPCRCACHAPVRASESPTADPRQLTIPGAGSPGTSIELRVAAVESAPRKRAVEEAIPIERWETPDDYLTTLVTALEDIERIRERLVAFRAENAGKSTARWSACFGAYLRKVRAAAAA